MEEKYPEDVATVLFRDIHTYTHTHTMTLMMILHNTFKKQSTDSTGETQVEGNM